jgi:hypothetical protein
LKRLGTSSPGSTLCHGLSAFSGIIGRGFCIRILQITIHDVEIASVV